jgi:hypothetical protein
MRYKVIACAVFNREISLLSATSRATLDVTWIRQGLHSYPDLLRKEIQREIDRAEAPLDGPDQVARPPEEYSAIILGFGMCSRAVSGLKTQRLPLVMPRSHDCIGILLGSHGKYRTEFDAAPGTYWFSPGWIEQSAFPCGDQCALMQDRFAELYDEDNAEYLVEIERESLQSYSRAALIQWPALERDEYRERTEEIARDFGWDAVTITGDHGWLNRLLNGEWEDHETIVCRPGYSLDVGEEDEVVTTVPSGGNAPGGESDAGAAEAGSEADTESTEEASRHETPPDGEEAGRSATVGQESSRRG